ncbi:Chondroitin synthase [compost metagenome]
MPKISYLVAVYNKKKFIVECIDSILGEQNLIQGIEIEICIVDDGSTDGSLDVIREKFGQYQNIKLAQFPENRGKNAAYNLAFTMSTGDYICVFGADDAVIPGRTRLMLDATRRTGKSVYGGLVAKDNELNETLYIQTPKTTDFYENVMGNKLSGGCSFLIKNHLSNVFPIPENLKFEDWWITYILTRDNKACTIDSLVTIYRIHGTNDCGTSQTDYQSKKKDYTRHLPYYNEMRRVSRDHLELKYIKKSENLRLAFLNKSNYTAIFPIELDKYWLQLFLYLTLGPKLVLFFYTKIQKIIRQ